MTPPPLPPRGLVAPVAWPPNRYDGPTGAGILLDDLAHVGARGVTLYPSTWQHAKALRASGIHVGGLTGRGSVPEAALEHVHDLAWVVVGDEPNVAWEKDPIAGPHMWPHRYVVIAEGVTERLKIHGYQGLISHAGLALRPLLFKKYLPDVDLPYLERLWGLAFGGHSYAQFTATAFNIFWGNVGRAAQEHQRITGQAPLLVVGSGFNNRSLDDRLAMLLGGWRWLMRGRDQVHVMGVWCLAAGPANTHQAAGQWGLIDSHTGRLTRSGRSLRAYLRRHGPHAEVSEA